MALSLRDRVRAGMGNMTEWLADRDDDITRANAEIEANANRFYGDAERAAKRAVSLATADAKERGDGRKASTSGPQTAPSQGARGRRSWDQQILDNADRLVADTQRKMQAAAQRAGDNQLVRRIAGEASLRPAALRAWARGHCRSRKTSRMGRFSSVDS